MSSRVCTKSARCIEFSNASELIPIDKAIGLYTVNLSPAHLLMAVLERFDVVLPGTRKQPN